MAAPSPLPIVPAPAAEATPGSAFRPEGRLDGALLAGQAQALGDKLLGLVRLGEPQALGLALELQLVDPAPAVRLSAVRLLGETGEPLARTRLENLLQPDVETNASVRTAAFIQYMPASGQVTVKAPSAPVLIVISSGALR